MDEHKDPHDAETSRKQQRLMDLAKQADVETLIACLVHDVNAHRARVNGSLICFGIDHPTMVENAWLQSIQESADALRSLIWFYFDLITPLVHRPPSTITDDSTEAPPHP